MTDNADVMDATDSAPADDGVATTQSAPEFSVPTEYQEKGWAKNIHSEADLWKTLDNAQGLIGRKTIGIPDFDNAKPEEIDEYYSHTRPKDSNEYEFDTAFSEDEKADLRKLFSDNGLTKQQAKNIVAHIQEAVIKDNEETYGEEGLKAEFLNRFGADWEKAIVPIKDALNSVLTKEQAEALNETLPNEAVGVLFALTKSIMDKYGANETDSALGKDRAAVKPKMEYDEFYKKMQEANKLPNGYELKKELMKQYYGE
jgi:hypothetical protein